ncbi:MAG TPA: hypothetical protein VKV20_20240 [Ktedonobacteraceae bacterium]|jgi:hypothetical protein|nr:hypothetical protein [Ktedonobacteraceae bacterium]
MMARADETFFPQNIRGYRLTILTQLRQVIENMHAPEQMFQWLGSVVTQSFDVSIAQFWTCENPRFARSPAQLRAMAYRDPSQPVHIIGEKVAPTVEQMARGADASFAQPVEQVFPQYLASLLKRYGLHFCVCCFSSRNMDTRPGQQGHPPGMQAEMVVLALLFMMHYPQRELVSTMSIILEQAIAVAEGHGLLSASTYNPGNVTPAQESSSSGTIPVLADLIPHKKQDARLMLSSNPFASPVVISDRLARRFYDAIDGHKSITEICTDAAITMQEAYKALQILLSLQYIELYTPQGARVEGF